MARIPPDICRWSLPGRTTPNEPDGMHRFVARVPHAVRQVRLETNGVARFQKKSIECDFDAKDPAQNEAVLGAIVSFHLRLGIASADFNNGLHKFHVDVGVRRQALPAEAMFQLNSASVAAS